MPKQDVQIESGRKQASWKAFSIGRFRRWLSCIAFLAGIAGQLSAAQLQDQFADRETTTDETGSITGDNLTASLELGEPVHGGVSNGASVWISWVAPTNCIATFSTAGSSFDTVLAAYYVNDGVTPALDNLRRAAADDDDGDYHRSTSTVVFGALAGKRYEIAIAGYRGARGTIQLTWSAQPVGDTPPIVISTPNDQALEEGAPLTLSISLQNPSAYSMQWYLNGRDLEERESPTLYIPSLSRTNLGQYKLRLSLGAVHFFTAPVEIQINSEGLGTSLARDKVYDTIDGPAATSKPVTGGAGKTPLKSGSPGILDAVNRGYNGSQIFNTIYATAGADEPAICGQSGAVTWLAYEPPQSGTLMLDTAGSDIGAAIAIFTYSGALTNTSQLEEITCAISVGGTNVQAIECAVIAGQSYVVGMVGVGDVRGIITLNYQLDITRPPTAPSVSFGISHLDIAAGQPLLLAATANGSPPLHFTWFKNSGVVTNESSGALVIPNSTPNDGGVYSVRVRNQISEAVSGSVSVRVLEAPSVKLEKANGNYALSFPTVSGLNYSVEYRDPSGGDVWLQLVPSLAGSGDIVRLTNQPPSTSDAWFRVRVE